MMKSFFKQIPGVKGLLKKVSFDSQFYYDKNFFKTNYSYSSETQNKIGYNMLLISHSLEKGMSSKKPRRFGVEKVKKLMQFIERYSLYGDFENKYDFVCAINVLRSYAEFYKRMGWNNTDEYKDVLSFLKKYEGIAKMQVGGFLLKKKDFIKDANMNYGSFLASRHSVREFSHKELSNKDLEKAAKIALLSPSACNRQMCKVYYVKDKKKAKRIIDLAQGFGGFEKDTINLLVVTFDMNANYMIGERNQGWFNAGIFSMNLVNALHSIGIGSCFCQFGNSVKEEEDVKKIVGIPASERVAVFIAVGYYCEEMLTPYSPRKRIDDVLFIR